MGRDEFGFDDDPFADFSQQCVVQTESRPSRTVNKSRRGGLGPRTRSSESLGAASHMSGESMTSGTRASRRRPTHDYNDDANGDKGGAGNGGELVLPGSDENRRRRRGDGRSRSGESVDGGRSVESSSSGGSGSGASRPRRGRRASLVSSVSEDQLYSQSAHEREPDYGYGDTRGSNGNIQRTQSNDLDYGYGPTGGAAPPGGASGRRRGRRMSVGAPIPPSAAAPEIDYGYGETKKSYDEKFGTSSNHGDEEEKTRTDRKHRSSRDRAVNISDIKNTDLTAREVRPGTSSRDLGGNPRPGNTSVMPMTLPDAQKPQRTRRASMLGAVGAAVEGTVGAVGDLAGSVGNAAVGAVRIKGGKEEEAGGTRRAKGRRMSMVQVIADEENNAATTTAGGDDRRRQGTMLERFG